MPTDDVKEWLTAEELSQYERYVGWAKKESKLYPKDYDVRHKLGIHGIPPILESLAACREEIENLKSNLADYKYFVKQRNERITRMKVLLEKHQWHKRSNGSLICVCCGAIYVPDIDKSVYFQKLKIIELGKGKVCKPDCAIAAELAGTVGGK